MQYIGLMLFFFYLFLKIQPFKIVLRTYEMWKVVYGSSDAKFGTLNNGSFFLLVTMAIVLPPAGSIVERSWWSIFQPITEQ